MSSGHTYLASLMVYTEHTQSKITRSHHNTYVTYIEVHQSGHHSLMHLAGLQAVPSELCSRSSAVESETEYYTYSPMILCMGVDQCQNC